APHEPAAIRELSDLLHDRGKPCDRSSAEVVAVCKTARQDDTVAAFEVGVLVPQVLELCADDLVDDPTAVAVRPCARKNDNAKFHSRCRPSWSSSKWKSSITWLASSCRHIASTRSRASCIVSASRLTSMYLPTRTSSTSRNPSVINPCLTVSPCGSLTTGLGVTMTRAVALIRCALWVGTGACRPVDGRR